jgi:hypothetical protein
MVETLIERAFNVHTNNPKQMDCFPDRYSLVGAKNNSRDAHVMASALRTDLRCFRLRRSSAHQAAGPSVSRFARSTR